MEYRKSLELYEKMYLIRKFEQKLLGLFSAGKVSGTTHTYQGQEAIAVAAMDFISERDAVFSNHRCHGHYIAYGGDVTKLYAEIMGKRTGICGGRGGSQHLCYKNFYTNGVQGGMVPCAAGFSYASKLKKENAIALSFIGDGTLGEGIVYETLNMCALFEIPLMIVVEDNGYAQTTPNDKGVSGKMTDRFSAFGIQSYEITSNDVESLHHMFEQAFSYVRENQKPCGVVVHTYRLGPHSKGDDFRDKEEIEKWRKKDPLAIQEKRIEENDLKKVWQNVDAMLDKSISDAQMDDTEDISTINIGISTFSDIVKESIYSNSFAQEGKYFKSINQALHEIFKEDAVALLIGEDILDPYGGSFKVTQGLSTQYPDRVISTPISEASFSGIANGMALNHMRPMVEIMFADFCTLIYDQVLNHGAKFKWMYNNQVNTPVIYRLPTGGKRGYGATHSQSPEKIFMGLPNVTVVAPTNYHNPGQILYDVYKNIDTPTIFIENKSFYTEELQNVVNGKKGNFYYEQRGNVLPTIRLVPDNSAVDCTVICYGGGIRDALQAAWKLMLDEEINVEVICPSLLSPLPVEDICNLISVESKYILVVDESFEEFGWASEVALKIMEYDYSKGIRRKVKRMGALPVYLSACKTMEEMILPSAGKIVESIMGEEI